MILTAHQPVYLPWLGLFHKIALSDTFVYFDQVQYLPKDYMNRNKIKISSDSVWLSIPVLRKGYRDLKTHEIRINNEINWRKKHLSSIQLYYKKSKFYDKYIDFFIDIYSKDWEFLSELNEYMLRWFIKILGINVKFLKASELNFEGTKSELVLDMCKKLSADTYIFGSLGKDYANIQSFNDNNINLIFQEYNHPKYSQINGNFISNLSIIDLLFNHGPKSLEILLSNNVSKDSLANTEKA